MKKTKFFIASICVILSSLFTTNAQWSYNGSKIYYNNGNVGIGTNDPQAKLHIESGSNNNYAVILATSLNGSFNNKLVVSTSNLTNVNTETFRISHEFADIYSRNNGYISFFRGGSSSGGFLTFGSNGTERMRINESGNVGIGTTNPKSILDVNGEISLTGRIGMYLNESYGTFLHNGLTMGHYSLGWFNDSWCSSYGPALWASSWGGIKFFTQGNPRLSIDYMGRIGINTVNPQNLLDVNGTIHAKQVLVDVNNWSDFVFDKGYKLASLNEVDEYININGHLPNVPSEQDVKNNGVDITVIQSNLLQKIEELTLYMIEQNKRIDKLENENRELKHSLSN